MEAVVDFLFLDSKITEDHDCNHEIKKRLLLVNKTMTKLDSILKSRDITLPTKVHIVNIHMVNIGFSNSHVQMRELDHKG